MCPLHNSLVVMASGVCSAPLWSRGFLPTPQPEDPHSCNNKCCVGLAWFPWCSVFLSDLGPGTSFQLAAISPPPLGRRGTLKPEATTPLTLGSNACHVRSTAFSGSSLTSHGGVFPLLSVKKLYQVFTVSSHPQVQPERQFYWLNTKPLTELPAAPEMVKCERFPGRIHSCRQGTCGV